MRCYYAYTCIANFLVLAYGIQSQISHYNNLWTVFLWLVRGDLLLLALWQRVRFIWDGTALQMLDYSFTKHYCGAQTRASHLSPASHHIFLVHTVVMAVRKCTNDNVYTCVWCISCLIEQHHHRHHRACSHRNNAPIAPSMRSMLANAAVAVAWRGAGTCQTCRRNRKQIINLDFPLQILFTIIIMHHYS